MSIFEYAAVLRFERAILFSLCIGFVIGIFVAALVGWAVC